MSDESYQLYPIGWVESGLLETSNGTPILDIKPVIDPKHER